VDPTRSGSDPYRLARVLVHAGRIITATCLAKHGCYANRHSSAKATKDLCEFVIRFSINLVVIRNVVTPERGDEINHTLEPSVCHVRLLRRSTQLVSIIPRKFSLICRDYSDSRVSVEIRFLGRWFAGNNSNSPVISGQMKYSSFLLEELCSTM
jgi:hypothetical protein